MKYPVKLIQEYNGFNKDTVLLVDGNNEFEELINEGIAVDLTDEELNLFLDDVESDIYEEMIFNILEEGEEIE